MRIKLKDRKQTRESGQTLILFTFFMIVLILFVGLGIDMGFAYITRARLSKAIDAACLTGIRAYKSADNGKAAKSLATSVFQANFGSPSVTPNLTWGSVNNNITLDASASTSINTFFIRVLPAFLGSGGTSWQTLPVGSSAQGTRPNLIMSLVLDDSGSMRDNGGAARLPGAVSDFIDLFDDDLDRASMSIFSSGSVVPVPMKHSFIQDIKNAVNAMTFPNTTCAERGLTNGLAQNLSATPAAGERVVRVIVFFTDGMANTFYYTFNCGPRDIYASGGLYDPNQISSSMSSGCNQPSNLDSIDPSTGAITNGAVSRSSCDQMHYEAQRRAERIAYLARAQGITIFSIGMGDPNQSGECGGRFPVLNPEFLKNIANTPDSSTYNVNQPVGDYAIATNSTALGMVFQQIGSEILSRLSR